MSSEPVETRTRILDATVQMLEQHGGQGVRMGDIARQAGVSRQALYLHFTSRTELLEATTLHVDLRLDLEERLAPSRAARTGAERLALYVAFWGEYLPDVYSVAKALMLAQDGDEAAAAAWKDRMDAMRDGCRAVVEALQRDGTLAPEWSAATATDALCMLLQVPNWENLTITCGWSHRQYVERMQTMAARLLLAQPAG